MVTVEWCLLLGLKPRLLNFDGFKTGHYYPCITGRPHDQAAHNFATERNVLDHLASEGKISIWTP